MPLQADAFTPHAERLVSRGGRENGLATPAELLIAPLASQHPYCIFLHA